MLSEFTTVLREKISPTDLQQNLLIDVKCKKKCISVKCMIAIFEHVSYNIFLGAKHYFNSEYFVL